MESIIRFIEILIHDLRVVTKVHRSHMIKFWCTVLKGLIDLLTGVRGLGNFGGLIFF